MGLRRAAVWLGLADHDEAALYDGQKPGDLYPGEDEPDDPDGQEDGAPAGEPRQIATVRPQNFHDALTIGEYFRQDVPVIINLHDMDTPDAKRIVDFASGLIFGRRGSIERVSSRVFLILPRGYRVITGNGALTDEGFFNQA